MLRAIGLVVNAYGLSQFYNTTIQIPRSFPSNLSDKMMHKFTEDWSSTLTDTSRRGNGGKKRIKS